MTWYKNGRYAQFYRRVQTKKKQQQQQQQKKQTKSLFQASILNQMTELKIM